ncbi:MAG: M64 family metallopeptidase [Candidatus Eisenbacteria bacterium]
MRTRRFRDSAKVMFLVLSSLAAMLLAGSIGTASPAPAPLPETQSQVMVISFKGAYGSLSAQSIRVSPGFIRTQVDVGPPKQWELWARITDGNGNLLHNASIGHPAHIFYDYLSQSGDLTGGIAQVEYQDFVASLPVPAGMAKIEIIDSGDEILFSKAIAEADIAAYSGQEGPQWNCTTIVDNGPVANRIDLVILGDGYTGTEMATYYADVDGFLGYLFSVSPFGEYQPYFNVHRVDVMSQQSGADHPENGTYVNTALDASYMWDGYTQRLLYCSESKAWSAAASAPSADQIIVVVNDNTYGGGGGGIAVGYHGDAMGEVISHEFGHSFGDLMDEYSYGITGGLYGSGANCEYDYNASNPKWNVWYDQPGVGWYSECSYTNLGRPTYSSCQMRVLVDYFCVVCREQIVRRIYEPYISTLIDEALPEATCVATAVGDTAGFKIERLTVSTTSTEWSVNDTVESTDPDTFTFIMRDNYIYDIKAAVIDTTPMVRRAPPALLENGSERSWWVAVTCDAGVADPSGTQSGSLVASGAAPVPSRGSISIDFELSADARVDLSIYDARGTRVAVLLDQAVERGRHVVRWDAKDTTGRAVAPGIYFLRVNTGQASATRKLVLLR